jgi:hypothetical protein
MQMSGNSTTAQCPQRRFVIGTVLLVTGIDVQKNAIVFHLFSTPDNDSPYYGDLSFQFDKGAVPSPDQALALVSQVLAPQAPGAPLETAASQSPEGGAPTTVAPAPSLALPATDGNSQSKEDTLQLKADHTFVLVVAGQTYQGGFQVDGNTIGLKISADTTTNVTIEGDHITDANEQTWVLQKQ